MTDVTIQDTGKIKATDASASFPTANLGVALTIHVTSIDPKISPSSPDTAALNNFGSNEIDSTLCPNPTFELKGVIDTTSSTTLVKDLVRMALSPTVKKFTDDIFTKQWGDLGPIGIYGVGTSTVFTDNSAKWQTNEWAGAVLIDKNNVNYTIASNTGTVLTLVSGTPATGGYWIATDTDYIYVKITSLTFGRKADEKKGTQIGGIVSFTLGLRQTIR